MGPTQCPQHCQPGKGKGRAGLGQGGHNTQSDGQQEALKVFVF